jgi:hypothetical protein
MWIIPILALVAVFFYQRSRVRHARQTVWKGGGFGMFSDINKNLILTEICLHRRSTENEVLRVLEGAGPGTKVAAVPVEKNFLEWGRFVLKQKWLKNGSVAVRHHPGWPGIPSIAESVTIVHATLDFDGRTGTQLARRISTYSYSAKDLPS